MATTPAEALFNLFFVIHTFGWIGCTIIFLTVIFSKVQRNLPWMNVCLSWIIACISYSILLLTGQLNNPTPNAGLCLIQASAIYAAPTLSAGTTLALAIHLWFSFRHKSLGGEIYRLKAETVRTIFMVALPYLAPTILFVSVLVFGLQNPDRVVLTESGMYCGLNTTVAGKASAIFVAIALTPALGIEAWIIISIYRNWRVLQQTVGNSLSRVIRLAAFTLFGVCALAVSFIYLSSESGSSYDHGRLANVLMALPPLSFVLIFGSQMDLLRVWTFWQKSPSDGSSIHKIFTKRTLAPVSRVDFLDLSGTKKEVDEKKYQLHAEERV